MLKNSKPFFDLITVEKIVTVIKNELAKENKTVDEDAVRTFIQVGKNEYENGILRGVAEGTFLATVQKGEIAYKVNPPSEHEIDEFIETAKKSQKKAIEAKKEVPGIPTRGQLDVTIKHMRASKLSHALNMINYYGTSRKAKLGVSELELTNKD